jgi:hypothetical protein
VDDNEEWKKRTIREDDDDDNETMMILIAMTVAIWEEKEKPQRQSAERLPKQRQCKVLEYRP